MLEFEVICLRSRVWPARGVAFDVDCLVCGSGVGLFDCDEACTVTREIQSASEDLKKM